MTKSTACESQLLGNSRPGSYHRCGEGKGKHQGAKTEKKLVFHDVASLIRGADKEQHLVNRLLNI
jgi:hypothetical protein